MARTHAGTMAGGPGESPRPGAGIGQTSRQAGFDAALVIVLLAAGVLTTSVATPAEAGARLRWWDDAARGTNARVPAPAAPQLSRRTTGGVELGIEPAADGGWEVWVDNPLFGPVEAWVEAAEPQAEPAFQASPALPARMRVPAQRRVLATRLATRPDLSRSGLLRTDPARAPSLRLRAIAGDPAARPQDVDYRFPLDTDQAQVSQGWGGHFSHRAPEHRHALDLAAAEGTPVLASRAGVVMQVAAGGAAQGRENATGEASGGNAIRILHDDGSMALYAHLADGGLRVRPGQRVRRGEPIARVGNTGYSTGPHLHFAVQINRGLRLETVPFRMSGPHGVLRLEETP